jgi:hypothetical protein
MYSRNLFRHAGLFWLLIVISLVSMVVGHVLIHGQIYDSVRAETFNPLTNYVSNYAAVWPEGLWIKASIISFGLALVWPCYLFMKERSSTAGLVFAKVICLIATGFMVVGLLMVVYFDTPPPRYSEEGGGFLSKVVEFFGFGEPQKQEPRTPEENFDAWCHNSGFKMFFYSFASAVFTVLGIEIWRKYWSAVLGSIVLLVAVFVFHRWTEIGTPNVGVPQRALLVLFAVWLVRCVNMLRKTAQSDPG